MENAGLFSGAARYRMVTWTLLSMMPAEMA
jgi:hypothetical protein